MYVWNNSGFSGMKWTSGATSYIVQGRDFFLNSGAKPGYTAYTYPNPLQAGDETPPAPTARAPNPPTSLHVR